MRRHKYLFLTMALLATFLLVTVVASGADAADADLRLLTYNTYIGTDPMPALLSGCDDFVAATTLAYNAAIASDFPARAAAIAGNISDSAPHLVGIQEAVVWQELWPGGNSVDFVQMILAALAAQGHPYTIIGQAAGADITFPTFDGAVRLLVSDVLLARADDAALKLRNVRTGTYQARLIVPTCIGIVEVPRQWVAVDVRYRGRSLHVVTTHLESALALTRYRQALELLAGPARHRLPTALLGDFNAEPGTPLDAAALLIHAGFTDTWSAIHPGDEGPTCCQAANLRNETSLLDERIDLVLTRGDVAGVAAQVVGNNPLDPVPDSGVFWASDHAGVVTTLVVGR
jgi:endonuclease/exonuclease/phosphatase family metal-dependent hydrolase